MKDYITFHRQETIANIVITAHNNLYITYILSYLHTIILSNLHYTVKYSGLSILNTLNPFISPAIIINITTLLGRSSKFLDKNTSNTTSILSEGTIYFLRIS